MESTFESKRPLSFQERLNALMEAKQKKADNLASLHTKNVMESQSSSSSELDAIDKETDKKLATEASLEKTRQETLESARIRGLAGLEKRLYTEGCKMLWNKVLFETVYDACWIDNSVKSTIVESMYDRFKATMEFAGVVCESSVTKVPNRMLSSINDVIMETAKFAAHRIAMEAKDDPNAEPERINFDLTDDEEDKLDKDLKDLGKDEIVDMVKDKVLTTVQDEKEASKKKADEIKDIEDAGKDDDDEDDSDDVEDTDEEESDDDKDDESESKSKSKKKDEDDEDNKDDSGDDSKSKKDEDASDDDDSDDKKDKDDKKSKSKKDDKDDDDELSESTVVATIDGTDITMEDWCKIVDQMSVVLESSGDRSDKVNAIANRLFYNVGITEAEAKDPTIVKKKLRDIIANPNCPDNKKYTIIQLVLVLLATFVGAFVGVAIGGFTVGLLCSLICEYVVIFTVGADGAQLSKIKIIRNQIRRIKSSAKDPKDIKHLEKAEEECDKAIARIQGIPVGEGFINLTRSTYNTCGITSSSSKQELKLAKSYSRLVSRPVNETAGVLMGYGFKEGTPRHTGNRAFVRAVGDGYCEAVVESYDNNTSRLNMYYRSKATNSMINRYVIEGSEIVGKSDYQLMLESKVREKEMRRINNSYGESLFESLMMYNRVGVESDAVLEGVNVDVDHIMNASMMESILSYTVLETLNTMGIYEFTMTDANNMKKALMEDMNALSMQMGNKGGKKQTRIGTMKFKRNTDKKVMSSNDTSKAKGGN